MVNEYQRKYWVGRIYEIVDSKAQDDRANDCIRWQVVLIFHEGFEPCDLLLNIRDPLNKYITFINSDEKLLSKTLDWKEPPTNNQNAFEQFTGKSNIYNESDKEQYKFEVKKIEYKEGSTVKSNPSALHIIYKDGDKKTGIIVTFQSKDERDNFTKTIEQ